MLLLDDVGPDDDGNFFKVIRREDGVLEVRARAVDPESGAIGEIDRHIAPGEPDYDRCAGYVVAPEVPS